MTNLVGPAEVAEMLGVSRQRVVQLASSDDFPKPIAVLRMGSVWRAEDVRSWAKARGRSLKE